MLKFIVKLWQRIFPPKYWGKGDKKGKSLLTQLQDNRATYTTNKVDVIEQVTKEILTPKAITQEAQMFTRKNNLVEEFMGEEQLVYSSNFSNTEPLTNGKGKFIIESQASTEKFPLLEGEIDIDDINKENVKYLKEVSKSKDSKTAYYVPNNS